MLKKISDLFKNDAFIPSSAVFPEIDKDRLCKELDLEQKGRKRGADSQPATESGMLDHIELDAISRVEALRRRGLENYETNREVYAGRLNQAGAARMQVEIEANEFKSRFMGEVVSQRSRMVAPSERLQKTYKWRNRFCEVHKLERPDRKASSLVSIIGIGFVMVMLESAGNAYLFSQKNPLGLLGGLMAAFLVSVGNVSVSTLFGMGTRYVNVNGLSQILIKLVGAMFFLAWVVFAVGYNFAVAHFRDAAETVGEWREAGEVAIQTLLANTISLHTIESYVLLILGGLISIIAFLKGYHSSDPYPGYSRVQSDLMKARADYLKYLEDAIGTEDVTGTLEKHRDDAVEALLGAHDEVQRNITDSVEALYGQKTLISGVTPFLEQCDIAANYLLAVYRDANRAARKADDEVPEHFSEKYAFGPFVPIEVEDIRRSDAEERVKEIEEMVDKAIKEIFEAFEGAVTNLDGIDELEGVDSDRDRILAIKRKARSDASERQADADEEETD